MLRSTSCRRFQAGARGEPGLRDHHRVSPSPHDDFAFHRRRVDLAVELVSARAWESDGLGIRYANRACESECWHCHVVRRSPAPRERHATTRSNRDGGRRPMVGPNFVRTNAGGGGIAALRRLSWRIRWLGRLSRRRLGGRGISCGCCGGGRGGHCRGARPRSAGGRRKR